MTSSSHTKFFSKSRPQAYPPIIHTRLFPKSEHRPYPTIIHTIPFPKSWRQAGPTIIHTKFSPKSWPRIYKLMASNLSIFEAWNPSSPYISSMILCSLPYRGTLSTQLAATRNDSLALAHPHPGEQASSSPCSSQKVSCSPSSAAAAALYHHLFDHHCRLLMLLQNASVLLQGA
jgi:hypothetical protein